VPCHWRSSARIHEIDLGENPAKTFSCFLSLPQIPPETVVSQDNRSHNQPPAASQQVSLLQSFLFDLQGAFFPINHHLLKTTPKVLFSASTSSRDFSPVVLQKQPCNHEMASKIPPPQIPPPKPPPPLFDVLTTTADDLRKRLEAGTITSLEIVESYLSHIEAHNTTGAKCRAIISTPPRFQLIAWAAQLDDEERRRGDVKGPLHGIPILLKVFTSFPL
jgi:hypothetical protein